MDALEYRGSATACKVFTHDIEQAAMSQVYAFLNHPAFAGCAIRIMPDVHAGAGSVIGFTSPIGKGVIPFVIGVDIGCGVQAVKMPDFADVFDFQKFDTHLRAVVPSGFNVRQSAYPGLESLWLRFIGNKPRWAQFQKDIEALAAKVGTDERHVINSIGSLGGGNHFIEVDKDQNGACWIVVHSGSRNFGLKVAEYHQRKAMLAQGTPSTLSKKGKPVSKPTGLEWLEGADAEEYLRDMRVAQQMAMLNRLTMIDALLDSEVGGGWMDWETVLSVHNFIGDDDIIRKGAISAKAGERVIIPWNMKDGIVLGTGKGNADWNNSAPHGAGRKMSRGEARRTLSLHAFEQQMTAAGVWSTCVGQDTIDEAPGAYKDAQSVEACIGDTVEVTDRLAPVYNFKASEDPVKSARRKERQFKAARRNADSVADLTLDGRPDKPADWDEPLFPKEDGGGEDG